MPPHPARNTLLPVTSAWIPVAIGAVALIGAIVDPRKYFTKLYENNPDAIMGFWGLSGSPEAFRVWIAIAGLFAIGVGVAALVI